jgi:hypothetical protein
MILVLAIACVAHQAVATRGVDEPDPPYQRVHHRGTRELRLYGRFDTELVLRATLLTEEVLRAGALELAYRGAMTAPEADAFVARAVAEAAEHWGVVFASMRAHDDARAFGIGENDPWRVRLFVGDRECTPLAVDRIGDPTAAQHVLYPQANEWADLWTARFAKDCGTAGPVTFSVAGPHASGEMRWK